MNKFLQNPLACIGSQRFKKTNISMILLMLTSLFVSPLQARETLKNVDVSLVLENVTVRHALKELEKQSDYKFFYTSNLVNSKRKVTLSFQGNMSEALHLILGKNVAYEISGKHIILERKFQHVQGILEDREKMKDPLDSLVSLPPNSALNQSAQPPDLNISGVVTDEANTPLPGVNVLLKGTTIGTTTDNTGLYTISVPDASSVLVFSFIGYQSVEMSVENRTTLNVSLEPDVISLDEVVVVGYGTKMKDELTGAISNVGNKTFETRPITNTMNALQGALPGVTVTRGSGRPGSENYSLQIRGASSISGSRPLILIDGIPGDLNLLNPNDISDVTVLKDAAASIYGARAADGVVLVTTKKGKPGRPTASYSGNYGIKTPKYLKEYANTMHMAEMYDEAMTNIGQPGVSQDIFDKIRNNAEPDVSGGWVKYLEGFPGFFGNHNWNDDVYGKGILQNHNVIISGGGDNTNYLFSTGYNSDGGVFNYGENESNRYNLRMNYDFRLFDRLNIETRTNFDNNVIYEPGNLDEALRVLPRMWNFLPVYNPSGQFYEYIGYGNPVQELLIGKSKRNSSKFSTNIKGELEILNDLKLTAQVGFVNQFYFANDNHPRYYRYAWEGGETPVTTGRYSTSWATYNNSRSFYGSYTTYLEYNKVLFNAHRLRFMAGASHEEYDVQNQSTTGYNFLSNELFTLNLADRTKVEYSNYTGLASDWALQSYFGRFSYSFNSKYYVDITTRIDGSSKFAPSKRWSAVFPAVSAAWNLSKERFIQSLGTVDNLRLRASWGQSGNQELSFGNYDYFPLISITGKIPLGSPNAGLPGAVSTIASETRTWETIETSNVGLDFAVLRSRLSGSFDYYIKYNNDMLVNKQLPATLGGAAPTQNIGKLETKGWDFSVGWTDKKGDFKYSVSAMISDSENKMIELQGNDAYGEGLVFAREGYSLYSYFGYQYDGIIQNAEELAAYKAIGNVHPQIGVGDVRYRDVDGDGKITAFGDTELGTKGDLVYLGNLLPRYTYSSNISLSYKNFDLNVFLQGVGQREGIRTGDFSQPFQVIWHQPLEYFYGKNWTPENTEAQYPRIIPGGMGFDGLSHWNWRYSSMRIDNQAYLRVKTITLAYNLPQSFCDKLKMQSARVYASGQDLFTISKGTWNKSFDPEETWERKDEQTYPFSSVVSLGLDFKF